MHDPAPLHPISRRHLDALTGELGILQHAIGSVPDPAHGYCVDDVSRALEVDLLHGRVLGWPAVAESAWRNLRFLEAAFDRSTGVFRNFRSITGDWAAARASQDSQGRAMVALGATIDGAPDEALREAAISLWDLALPATGRLTALRAQASVVLGCDARIGVAANEPARTMLAKLSRGIDRKFRGNASSDWFWPENELNYENALLARCLIVAGRRLRSPDMVGTGIQVIDWLFRVQTAASGHLSPIGNGWWSRGGVRSRFDQQPIEATALLLAAEAALQTTGDPRFGELMELAYAWFLGRNDLDISVAHPARGACSDGLTPSGVNANEGAESTLMWLMAAEHMRATRATTMAAASTQVATHADSRTTTPGQRPAILHLSSAAR
jgi:hypothetical protein